MAKGKRSPVAPSVTLREAVQRAESVLERDGENFVPLEAIARAWNFSPKSSGLLQAISTLIQFGLLEDEGAKENRQFKLTERSLDIIHHSHDSDDRINALKAAALAPSLHNELWEKFSGKLPSDEAIRVYLVRQRDGTKFNHAHVDAFIRQFRDTLHFASLTGNGRIEPEGDAEHRLPELGDFVQWTSQDSDQFSTPRRLVGLSEDGKWGFVEGSETGLAVNELSVAETPGSESPPPNPHFEQLRPKGPFISFPLTDGNRFELRLDEKVSAKDFERLKKLIELSEDSLVLNEQ